jgi:hypothetical protein
MELSGMDWPECLRDQAANYRQLAEQTDDPVIKNELLELASVCVSDGRGRPITACAVAKADMKEAANIGGPWESS